MESAQNSERKFTVVLRGPSVAFLPEDIGLGVVNIETSLGFVICVYSTRWLENGSGSKYPGHLSVEITGLGQNLDEVIYPFYEAGSLFLSIFSLVTNSAVLEPEIELAFECTATADEREYVQFHVSQETSTIYPARPINTEITTNIINALKDNPQRERILRAANQYRYALRYWRLGLEVYVVAHLWMAIEALTKAKLDAECAQRGIDDRHQLARTLGVDPKDLDATIRKRFLLRDDEECYKKAREVSNAFEHGYQGVNTLRNLAIGVGYRMARYVREAILDLCQVAPEVVERLNEKPFSEPLPYAPFNQAIRGKLIGKGQNLAADGNRYPYFDWSMTPKSQTMDGNGIIKIEVETRAKAKFAEGISFQLETSGYDVLKSKNESSGVPQET